MPEASGATARVLGQRRSVTTNDGVRLSVIETGAGRPFVILPAWTNSAAEYHGQVREFGRDHRVLAIDMRAHGEAEQTEHGHRVSRYAADLHYILRALGINGAVLMGHSMGCSVIWSYLDLYGPGRIAGLVLVDQPLLIQPWWSDEERLAFGCLQTAEELLTFCASLAGPDGERFTRDMFVGLFTPAFPAGEVDWAVKEILKMPRRHAATLMLDHATRDWRDVIARIRLPTLVVGARGSIFPVECQAWIAQQIPGARLAIFEANEGGSHFMCMENPIQFNSIVRDFLA